jgi:hypothetical protein
MITLRLAICPPLAAFRAMMPHGGSRMAVGRELKWSAVKAAIIANALLVTGAITHPGASSETNAYADV